MQSSRIIAELPFRPPDWSEPLDLEVRLAKMPAQATVRGLFFNDLFAQFPRTKALARRPRYLTFSNYPFAEWCEVLTEAAHVCFPGSRPREGIRQIGKRALPALAESHAGRVLLAMAGSDPLATLRISGKAFALAQSNGSCTVASLEPGLAIMQIRDAWDYPDAYYVGVYEGALELFGSRSDVEVRVHSLCDVDLRLRWKPR